ncbi:MAG TPA: diacylglycerol kinase family protein [Longimicrobiales bacterium]|nr:diacylglycerol kinase family protein [Longimicrobiales bacterium]
MNPTEPMIVIVNPTSGGASERMAAEATDRLAGAKPEIRMTERPGHATELAFEAARRGVRAIVAVGGDGTVHETANGLLRALESDPLLPAVLGIVPVGTGNDFVKMLPGTARRDEAYQTILAGEVRRVDAGLASWDGGEEYFVNSAGTGIDVEVVRAMGSHRGTSGPLDYVVALMRALRRYRPIPVSLSGDGHGLQARIMIAAVGNGRCVGGTFRICPDAIVDDGLFDVCTVHALSIATSILTAARIVRGTHTGTRGVRTFRAAAVQLTVPEGTDLFFQLDGELRELMGAKTLKLEIRRGALPVFAGGKGEA